VPGGVLSADGYYGSERWYRGRSRWFPHGPSQFRVQAGISVPVELHGGPIGSLDLYSAKPRDWDDSEVSALQAYAGIVANLLGSAAAAHLKGRLAEQLQTALAHGAVIEQAKGVLMEREGQDAATAYERLRAGARSSSRKVADVARELLAGVPLPPTNP
jgi:GAF domain-containing protein